MPKYEQKSPEERGYPSGWAYVKDSTDAYNYLRGLWDSPLDAFRLKTGLSREELDKFATNANKVAARFAHEAYSIVGNFLPPDKREVFEKFPPYFIVVPKELFVALGKAKPETQTGNYAFYSDTSGTVFGIMRKHKSNVFLIRSDVYNAEKENRGEMLKLLAHEALHYAEALSTYSSESHHHDAAHSLHEGMTEYFASKLIDQHGYSFPKDFGTYPLEFRVAQALAYAVGEQELKRAYFTNDFQLLRREVDRNLGFGSWDKMLTGMEKSHEQGYDDESFDKVMNMVDDLLKKKNIDFDKYNEELRRLGKIK